MKIEKLYPECKDYVWGGRKLRDKYGKKTECDPCAESWELSFHKDGLTRLSSGETLKDSVTAAELGKNASAFQNFPLLIKFIDAKAQVLVYERCGKTFVVNFSPNNSYEGYYVEVKGKGDYKVVLSTDETRFGGLDRISKDYIYKAEKQTDGKYRVRIYIPSRTALCLGRA